MGSEERCNDGGKWCATCKGRRYIDRKVKGRVMPIAEDCPDCTPDTEGVEPREWSITICGKCGVKYGHRYCPKCGSSRHRESIKVVPASLLAVAKARGKTARDAILERDSLKAKLAEAKRELERFQVGDLERASAAFRDAHA